MADEPDKKPPARKLLTLGNLKGGGGLSPERLAELQRLREAMRTPAPEPRVSSRGYLNRPVDTPKEASVLDVVFGTTTLYGKNQKGEVWQETKHGRPVVVREIVTDEHGQRFYVGWPVTHAQQDNPKKGQGIAEARYLKLDRDMSAEGVPVEIDLHRRVLGNDKAPSYLLLDPLQVQRIAVDETQGVRLVDDGAKSVMNRLLARRHCNPLPLPHRGYHGLEDTLEAKPPATPTIGRDEPEPSGGRE